MRKINWNYVLTTICILLMCLYINGERFWNKLFLAGVVGTIIISCYVGKKYNFFAAISYAYVVILGLFTSLFIFYINLNSTFDTEIRNSALQGTVFFIIITTPFLLLDKSKSKYVEYGIALSSAINCLFLLGEYAFTNSKVGLYDGNTSINGCMLAITTPILFKYFSKIKTDFRFVLYALPGIACFITQETVPVIAMMLIYTLYLFIWFREEAGTFGAIGKILIALFMLFFAAYKLQGDNIFKDRGRFGIYNIMNKWTEQKKDKVYYFGTGTGTYHFIGQKIQEATGYGLTFKYFDARGNVIPDNNEKKTATKVQRSGYYIFLHSDWLQAKFEQGWIGLLLFAGFAASTLLTAFKNGRQSSAFAFIAYLCVGLVNYPNRIGMGALIAISVLFLCFNQEDERKEVNHAM